MNEFLSCVWKGRLVDEYYEDCVKLSRYAPLMTKEQKLSQFILGLKDQLAEEVNALCPISLADALIWAKSKLTSFQVGNRKRPNPFPTPRPYRPIKINSCSSQISRPFIPANPRPLV